MKTSTAIVVLLTFCLPAYGQEAKANTQKTTDPATRKVRIPRVTRAPRLEDFLNQTPREAEAEISEFRQREPGDGTPVSRPTKAYVSYDDRKLYVVFVCTENPGEVRASMAKREEITANDNVAVYLDTFHDRQRAFVFAVNPLGIQRDSIATEGQERDVRFDTVWRSEGRVTPEGFIVWMAIPFHSLRFPNADRQTWGIALSRTFVRNNETSFWPFITKREAGFVRQLAELEGIEGIPASRNIQLVPYFTGAHEKVLSPNPASYSMRNDLRIGFDMKAVIHNSFTLDATVNPDFSQVESDDPQITLNQRFEVYFPEKRPFFLENAGFFRTPINLFFSRRIADPEFGARLTGKSGHWTVALLASDDRAPGQRVSGTGPDFGHRTVDGVLRVQREVGDQSTIGLFAGGQEFASTSNVVSGFDARIKLNPNWFLTGQYVRSFDRQAKGKKRDGMAAQLELAHYGRHFTYDATYLDRSPDFRAPLGFIPRVDIRQVQQYAGYFWLPESSKILSIGPAVSVSTDWDRLGRLQDWYANGVFSLDFRGSTGFKLTHDEAYELIDSYRLRYTKNGVSFYTERLKQLSFYGGFSKGTSPNYNPAPGIPLFTGASMDANVGFTYRPTSRLRVEEFYFFDHLRTPSQLDAAPVFAKRPVYTSHLSRTKLNYQFTRALSARAIVDYYAVLPDSSLFYQDRFKQLSGDVLLTYLLHPGTAIYLGYNNRYENLAIDPEAPRSLRRYGAPDYLASSQLFVKLSYLFKF